jgi:hypothetical protein
MVSITTLVVAGVCTVIGMYIGSAWTQMAIKKEHSDNTFGFIKDSTYKLNSVIEELYAQQKEKPLAIAAPSLSEDEVANKIINYIETRVKPQAHVLDGSADIPVITHDEMRKPIIPKSLQLAEIKLATIPVFDNNAMNWGDFENIMIVENEEGNYILACPSKNEYTDEKVVYIYTKQGLGKGVIKVCQNSGYSWFNIDGNVFDNKEEAFKRAREIRDIAFLEGLIKEEELAEVEEPVNKIWLKKIIAEEESKDIA